MEKWALDKLGLYQIIDSGLLPVYYDYNYDHKYFSKLLNPFPVPSLDFADYDPEKLFFKRAEVEHFEKMEANKRSKATKRKKGPSQIAKDKCREVAKKLREQNPIITIASAIRHKDMIEVSKKKDESYYLEDTIRGWIKDLWPEELRKPGRRKGA